MQDITTNQFLIEFKGRSGLTRNNLTVLKVIGKREENKLEKESSIHTKGSTMKEMSSKELLMAKVKLYGQTDISIRAKLFIEMPKSLKPNCITAYTPLITIEKMKKFDTTDR